MNKKFIVTKDLESAALLRKMGLVEISYQNGCWSFLSDGKITFENLNNVTYTDHLFF